VASSAQEIKWSRTRPKVSGSVATERTIASEPAAAIEVPRVDTPLPVVGVPADADHAACDIEDIPVAIVEEVALFAVRLLGDHLVEIGYEFRFALEHVVRGHDGVGLDLLVVGVLGEVARRERDSAQVLDRLRFRADTRLEAIGDPETLASFESRWIVGRDGVELHAGVNQLQNDRRKSGELVDRGADSGSNVFPERSEPGDQTITRCRIERGKLGPHDFRDSGFDLPLLGAGNIRLGHGIPLSPVITPGFGDCLT
jgi:hypothetical protein